jgi:hypothetical protein
MSRDFLPEYSTMAVGSRYRALWRLFAGERWRMVRKDKKPVECDTASQAIAAAKEHVARILNPKIHAEQMEGEVADVLGIEAWRLRKEREATEERKQVFGAGPAKIVFPRRGKPVEVVSLKRRRA